MQRFFAFCYAEMEQIPVFFDVNREFTSETSWHVTAFTTTHSFNIRDIARVTSKARCWRLSEIASRPIGLKDPQSADLAGLSLWLKNPVPSQLIRFAGQGFGVEPAGVRENREWSRSQRLRQ